MKELKAERVREILDYFPETGEFRWKVRSGSVKAGDVAGTPHSRGYIQIMVDGYIYLSHRLAWLYVYGYFPEAHIDHINCVKNDNRIANLREANYSENGQNIRKPRRSNKLGFLGVYLHNCGKFVAQIQVNGKNKNLGYFSTPGEAHAAYLGAKRSLHQFGTL